MILFDKGFYKQTNFNQLTQAEQEPNQPNVQETSAAQESIEATDHPDQQDQADEPAQIKAPAKKYKTIKEAIEAIAEEEYESYEPILTDKQRKKRARERAKTRSKREKEENEMAQIKGGKAQIAEKWIKLTDYKGKIRLIVIKDKRMRLRQKYRQKGSFYIKNEEGHRLFDEVWEVFYHAYLTNVPTSQMSGAQIVTAYKGR